MWKVPNVRYRHMGYSHNHTKRQSHGLVDSHMDNQPEALSRDKGSEELQPTDSSVSKTNSASDCPI
jgi:hypothetical protein